LSSTGNKNNSERHGKIKDPTSASTHELVNRLAWIDIVGAQGFDPSASAV
jgi:hypothetical protein